MGLEAHYRADELNIRVVFYFFSRKGGGRIDQVVWSNRGEQRKAENEVRYEQTKIAETVGFPITLEILADWAAMGNLNLEYASLPT